MNGTIEIWKLIMSAGGLAFFGMVGTGIKWLRDGAKAKDIDAKKQIKDWNETVVRQARYEQAQHYWWRNWAGRLEHVITSKFGEEHLPERRPYPVEPAAGDETLAVNVKETGGED